MVNLESSVLAIVDYFHKVSFTGYNTYRSFTSIRIISNISQDVLLRYVIFCYMLNRITTKHFKSYGSLALGHGD